MDWAHLSRSNRSAHLIGCIESSGGCRFHKVRRVPCIPLCCFRHRKTSDQSAVCTHGRFTIHCQLYAQSQIVARETFAREAWANELPVLSLLANCAIKRKGRFLGRERPLHNGLSKASWKVLLVNARPDTRVLHLRWVHLFPAWEMCLTVEPRPRRCCEIMPKTMCSRRNRALNKRSTSACNGTKCNWNAKGTLGNCPEST